MTEQEFESYLSLGHELNGVEFKGPMPRTDKPFFAKVVRAILGMANRRDGGLVIIGVEEADVLNPVGLDDEQLATWTNYDDLMATVNSYARPSVNLDLEPIGETFRNIVAIRVQEFGEIPILCAKQYQDPESQKLILRPGACYVRSRNKPETSEIPSEEEMRELLELAIDKGVTRFVARVQRLGLLNPILSPPTQLTHDDLYREQMEEME